MTGMMMGAAVGGQVVNMMNQMGQTMQQGMAGAGQPQFEGWSLRKTCAQGLYQEDTELAYKSQDNSGVQALYGRILDKIGGPVAHELLHTHYKSKKYQD